MKIGPLLLALLLWLLPQLGHGDTARGRVVDESTATVIPYVNIGIVRGERGTVSNENGDFYLDLTGVDSSAIVRFSFIGYENYDVRAGDLGPNCSEFCEIELTPKTIEMQKVVVYPREYKEKVVGNPHAPSMMQGGFTEDSLGYELGILVKLRKRPTILKTLTLHGIHTSYDSVFYRINVYEMADKTPGRNILKEPIYITLTDFKQGADISIDLTPYHLLVQDDFVITLEYVKELGEGDLTFSTGIFNGKLFYRKTSQADWLSAPFGLGMSLFIRYQK